jgi:CO/xanthine dehydrogenase Mo-binding subunit
MTQTLKKQEDLGPVARFLTEKEISRRTFLKGGGALVVGVSLAGGATAGRASAATGSTVVRGATNAAPDVNQIDTFVQVNPDNTATIFLGNVELGQGSPTGLLQIAAEELDMGFDQVKTVQVQTGVSPSQFSAGSSSISRGGAQMRGATAAARQALVNLASAKLGVPVAQLSVDKGVVSGGGKSVKYGDLVGGQAINQTVSAQKASPKDPSTYKIVGTRIPRLDIPGQISGKYTYIQNVRVPGMLHGRIVRPRGQAAYTLGAKILSVDESSIKHLKNVQIVRKGDFLGVVAPVEYTAIQAAAALKVKWENKAMLSGDGNLDGKMRKTPTKDNVQVNTGDVDKALASASKVVSGSFFYPYQAHVSLGPNCAIGDVKGSSVTVLCNTQGPYSTQAGVAQTLGVDAGNVKVIMFPGSGTYGHSTYDDVTNAAALMSQALQKPVRVQFMRWDEHGWDQFGPAAAVDLRAGIDAKGNIVGYDFGTWTHGWMSVESSAELSGIPLPASTRPGSADTSNSASFYAIPNRRVIGRDVGMQNGFMKGTYLRGPNAPQTLFASEQVIDQLAYEAKLDPVAFRTQNLPDGSRWQGVLDALAKAANWQPKVAGTGRGSGNVVTGRGIALGGFANTQAGVAADIEVNKKTGKIVVKHLYAAQDAGLTVNPALVENQMSGCLVQGCSRALLEEVRFNKVRSTSLDWNSYPILRFKDSPNVTTVVVQRINEPSTGSGEPSTVAVAAAIGNAFFDATGVRLHSVPMSPARVRAALAAAKA